MGRRMNGWTCMDGWVDGYGWVDEWMYDGWVGGWVDMDGWMDVHLPCDREAGAVDRTIYS